MFSTVVLVRKVFRWLCRHRYGTKATRFCKFYVLKWVNSLFTNFVHFTISYPSVSCFNLCYRFNYTILLNMLYKIFPDSEWNVVQAFQHYKDINAYLSLEIVFRSILKTEHYKVQGCILKPSDFIQTTKQKEKEKEKGINYVGICGM